MIRKRRHHALSITVAGDEPPTEFRIFTAGDVETTKGTFSFDAVAAASVMAEYEAHGIDLMIDYDHASLSPIPLDPAQSGKAAGWFNIEVRNGELWAVNVRWTESAAAQLRAKEWRFVSPAFNTTEDGRIANLLNVAITNLPATRNLDPLMAASIAALGEGMDPKLVSEALDALIAGDAEKCQEILKGIVAAAAGADPDAATEDAPPPAGDGGADEAEEMAAAPAAGSPDGPATDPKKEDPATAALSISRMMRLSEASSFAELLSKFETYRASHLELEQERQKLAAERSTLEAAERRKLCVELVSLAGRAPATVWADDKAKTLKPYLAEMPMESLRAMHADEIKAKGGKVSASVKPPVASPAGAHGLSAEELAICASMKCDPAAFAALKNTRDGVKGAS